MIKNYIFCFNLIYLNKRKPTSNFKVEINKEAKNSYQYKNKIIS